MMQRFLTALLVASLAGCGLFDDRYERPALPIPDSFAEGTPATGATTIVPRDWWVNFGSEPLNNLVGQALRENLDISAAIARLKQADAQARIAGAPLLPQVSLTGDATRSQSGNGNNTTIIGANGTTVDGTNGTTVTNNGTTSGGSTIGTTINSAGKPRNSFSGRLEASYELDFWGRNASALESAEATEAASRYDRETVTLTIAGEVVNSYFTILGLQDRIEIAKENLVSAEGLLDAINKRASVGLLSGLDTAQQENLVATQRTVLPGLNLQLRQNLDALAILLGQLPESVRVETPNGVETITAPDVAPGLPSTLLARRPDVANAEAQLIAANADINQARAAFFPAITLTASGGYASDALNTIANSGSQLWSLGLGLTQTIFDNGLLFGQLDLNKARHEELLGNYRKVVLSAYADTEDSLANVRETAVQEAAQREAVRTAQTAFDLSQRQFQAGITDITTTLNTQRSLFTAQDALIQTRLAHLQAIVSLYQALGGGWSVNNQ